MNSNDVESISVAVLFENAKNTIFNVLYNQPRQPKDQIEQFQKFLKNIFLLIKNSNKQFHVVGDFNLNVLDYKICKKLQQFSNIIYENGMIPIVNKLTRVINKTATATNHILTKSYTETIFKTAILKCDVSDHFPICVIIPSLTFSSKNELVYIYTSSFNPNKAGLFEGSFFSGGGGGEGAI